MAAFDIWITETQGRKDITSFDEKPKTKIRGDTVRFIGFHDGKE